MRKRLVRFCYNLGWHRLAHTISPSLYYQLVGEHFVKQCTEACDAMAAFMSAVAAAFPPEEDTGNVQKGE